MILQTEITKLRNAIIKIINLAENQVIEAMVTLSDEANSKGKVIRKTESKIDKLDVKIDELCQNIFALQQPVASDLRFIMSAMQISNEAERIGDLSLSIIKKAKTIKEQPELITKFGIAEITNEVEQIALKTLLSFQNLDEQNVSEVFKLNKQIKHKSTDAIHNIITEMKDNPSTVVAGTHLIMSLKHMERIAGHSSNIAESVYFMIHAKIAKKDKK